MKLAANCQKGGDPARSGNGHRLQPYFLKGWLLLSLAGLSGCATPALWKHTAARAWSPECLPDQFLATTTTGRQDVIEVFRQTSCVGEKVHRRLVAWNLSQPPANLIVGRRALRQFTNACDRVEVIPSFTSDAVPANVSSTSPGYAVTGPLLYQFRVHREGVSSEPLTLPYTNEKTRTLARLAVLPLAITADAVIVAAVCCASAGYGGAGACTP